MGVLRGSQGSLGGRYGIPPGARLEPSKDPPRTIPQAPTKKPNVQRVGAGVYIQHASFMTRNAMDFEIAGMGTWLDGSACKNAIAKQKI